MTKEETKDETRSLEKPEFGATGRKIIYDKDGKPYVKLLLPSVSY